MRILALSVSAQGTLDSSGNGTLQVGPGVPGHVWFPTLVTISMTGAIPAPGSGLIASLSLYAGNGPTPDNLVDFTYNVNAGSSTNIAGQTLYSGQFVYVVWANGNASATVTLNVNGTRKVP
jgi:hypothetical protein